MVVSASVIRVIFFFRPVCLLVRMERGRRNGILQGVFVYVVDIAQLVMVSDVQHV